MHERRDRCARQGLSSLAKEKIVAELTSGWKKESGTVVILKDLLQSLSAANLLLLASKKVNEVANTKGAAPVPSKFPTIFHNFKICMAEAWPGCTLETNKGGNKVKGSRRFTGYYLDGLSQSDAE